MASTQMLRFRSPGGLTLAARAWGDPANPTVLMLHSMMQSSAVFDAVGPSLAAAGRYAVALDLRGHGESDDAPDGRYDVQCLVDDVLAVLQQLPARPAIIGMSLGGTIAMVALGEGRDALASALLVVDTTPWIDREVARRYAESMKVSGSKFARHFDAANFAEMSGVSERVEAAARQLKLPVLLVRGQHSDLVSTEAAQRFAALGENFSEFDIEGAGHYVAADGADAFNAVVLEFLERAVPRGPRVYEAGSDSRTLRDALGAFATGITVVTARARDGRPIGITANSFTSVSLDPPLLLFCPAKKSRTYAEFVEAEAFAVNVLHIGQQPTSALFASPVEDKFAVAPWECWDLNVPILSEASASFECRRHAVHDAGDHAIVVGEVVRARFEQWRDPLIFFRGKYRRLHFD
jgi:flavin reductase (DIM6/NTAB) family NADH-FMN oxidoreductase RutF/pimeloyl-ACP methyl ester carboxylesterase